MKIFVVLLLLNQLMLKEELIMIVEITRHGVRNYNEKNGGSTDVGFTKIGYDDSVKIGQRYKTDYDLFKSIRPKEVLVKTSNRIRTVLTALGIYEGIFKEEKELLDYDYMNKNFDFQGEQNNFIMYNNTENPLFKPAKTICKNLLEKNLGNFTEQDMQLFVNYFNTQIKPRLEKDKFFIHKHVQNTKNESDFNWEIFDFTQSSIGKKNQIVSEETFLFLDALTAYQRRIKRFKEPYQSELFLNNILQDMIQEIDDSLQLYSQKKQYKKYILYSGHDHQIEALISYFGQFSKECAYDLLNITKYDELQQLINNREDCNFQVPYHANYQFQIYKDKSRLWVKVLFKGKVVKVYGKQKIGLYEFRKNILSKVNQGFTTFCQYGKEIYLRKYQQKRRRMKIKYFLIGLAMCAYILYKRLKTKKPVESIEKDAKKVKEFIKKEK